MTVTGQSNAPAEARPGVTGVIDGVEITVPKGTMIIRAAEELGVAVPRFCDHPLLDPVAACRQCLVEVATPGPDGSMRPMPKPQPACAVELTEGMQVQTQVTSRVAAKAQHAVMEFLLINHPLDCPVCDKGGECPLQNQAISDGRGSSRFIDVKRTFPKPIRISSAILLDRERCIVCQRCTRFSKQIAGDPFIDLQKRGAAQQIGTFSPGVLGIATRGEQMLDESGVPFASYFSGNTIQICPVGALTSATYRFRSRPFDLVSTPSVCDGCSSGCAQRVDTRRDVVLRRLAGDDPEVNEEWLCDKGRFAFHSTTLADRLSMPLVRNAEGTLEPVSWPVALDAAATGLARARDGQLGDPEDPHHGASGVAVLPGGMLRLEDAYAYSKFARVALGTNDIDHRSRPASAEEEAFLAAHVAGTGLGVTFADLEAAPAVLLVALEPEEEAAITFLRLRKAVHKHGQRVFSVAAYASRGLSKLSGTLLRTAPGGEAEVLDELDGAEAGDALRQAGALILVGERAATARGALTAVAGLAARTGARIAWIPRRAGERGGVDAGTLPSLLPGGRRVADDAARAEVETAWGVSLPATPGRSLEELLVELDEGRLAGVVVGGLDLDDLPDPEVARRALERAGFVVSLEVRGSSVTELADVVLPVAPAVNAEGTFRNWEGRDRPFARVLSSQAIADARVLGALANAMDVDFGVRDVRDAGRELASLGSWQGERPAMPAVDAPVSEPVSLQAGQAVLASWNLLLGMSRYQDGDPFLAGTAHRAHARMSPRTAELAGIGGRVRVSTAHGEVVLPMLPAEMPDDVVWLPTNSAGCELRSTLGVGAGEVVDIEDAPAAPVLAGSSGAADSQEGVL